MLDPFEAELSSAVQAMQRQCGMTDAAPSNVIQFPQTVRAPHGVVQAVTQKCADALLTVEALADLMDVIAKETERGATPAIIIDMLRKGELAARNALERLES